MAQLPAGFLPHMVTVKPLTGSGGLGPVYGSPFAVPAMVEEGSRLVRDADGAEVVSSARVHCGFDVVVPVGSMVTVWAGTGRERVSEAISVDGSEHPLVPGYQTIALA